MPPTLRAGATDTEASTTLGNADVTRRPSGARDRQQLNKLWLATVPTRLGGGNLPGVPRTLIVDDSEQFLASAERLLGVGGVAIVGTARSRTEAVRLAKELRPEVALVDIDLDGESGLDVARDLARLVPAPIIVLISTHTEAEVSEMVSASPAAGFIPKSRLDAAAVRSLLP